MRHAAVVTIVPLGLVVTSCTDDGARQLFETAQLEERQNNQAHAKELYREILAKHPNSDYLKKADARLREIGEKP